jgi:hypothetical protein
MRDRFGLAGWDLCQGHTEIVLDLGIVRRQTRGGFELRQRILCAVWERLQCGAEVGVRFGVIGVESQGRFVLGYGLGKTPGNLRERRSEILMGLAKGRTHFQRSLELKSGFLQPARSGQGISQIVQVLRIAGICRSGMLELGESLRKASRNIGERGRTIGADNARPRLDAKRHVELLDRLRQSAGCLRQSAAKVGVDAGGVGLQAHGGLQMRQRLG